MAEAPRCSEAVIERGDFVKPNYHQARRQKEESRKARQQKKLQRRLDRTTTPVDSPTEALPTESNQLIDPIAGLSS